MRKEKEASLGLAKTESLYHPGEVGVGALLPQSLAEQLLPSPPHLWT